MHGLVWKHADYSASGKPDLEVILNAWATYWEVKYARVGPDEPIPIKGTGLQHLTLQRIVKAGLPAHYIVFCGIDKIHAIYIIPPDEVVDGKVCGGLSGDDIEEFLTGSTYESVVTAIIEHHYELRP